MTVYENNTGGQYAGYFVQELREPADMGTQEFRELYSHFAKRILWMDGDAVPGAFQMNTAWYFAVPERDPIFTEHSHDCAELLGFFGSDPDDPYELGGVIEFSVNGEARRLTRSTMIYLPGGFAHNPMRILEVRAPIFHFSIVTDARYDGRATYK
ncbi:MAG: hypothetical protein LBJ99_03395 [Oscillospiraceae bacterium]|jgi:hypothetical protein|nr:hypothetical protein [Oscillospiraceae bacterium]